MTVKKLNFCNQTLLLYRAKDSQGITQYTRQI